jgi:hypothetical protein
MPCEILDYDMWHESEMESSYYFVLLESPESTTSFYKPRRLLHVNETQNELKIYIT